MRLRRLCDQNQLPSAAVSIVVQKAAQSLVEVTNQEGLDSQLEFLLKTIGFTPTQRLLQELIKYRTPNSE